MSQFVSHVVDDLMVHSSDEAWHLDFAHPANHPLAVVSANLNILTDMLRDHPEVAAEPCEGRDLSEWMFLASVCVADAREGVHQLSTLMALRSREALLARARRSASAEVPQKRILVVDVYESFARMVERTLRGFDVTIVLDTESALNRISGGERFDAIVCELDMPRMRGGELYREIRRVDTRQADGFVFVSSSGANERLDRPLVCKPFDPSHLRSVLMGMFGSADTTEPEPDDR